MPRPLTRVILCLALATTPALAAGPAKKSAAPVDFDTPFRVLVDDCVAWAQGASKSDLKQKWKVALSRQKRGTREETVIYPFLPVAAQLEATPVKASGSIAAHEERVCSLFQDNPRDDVIGLRRVRDLDIQAVWRQVQPVPGEQAEASLLQLIERLDADPAYSRDKSVKLANRNVAYLSCGGAGSHRMTVFVDGLAVARDGTPNWQVQAISVNPGESVCPGS